MYANHSSASSQEADLREASQVDTRREGQKDQESGYDTEEERDGQQTSGRTISPYWREGEDRKRVISTNSLMSDRKHKKSKAWLSKLKDWCLWVGSSLNPTWTCKEIRQPLDRETSEKIKETHWLTRIVYLRSLGFVYFFAFLVAFNQVQGLIGSDGILPATEHVSEVMNSLSEAEAWERVKSFPSLFLIFPASDFWIHAVPFTGMVLSLCLFVKGASNGFLVFALWILYQTIMSVGQAWYSFGWESQLLELGFLSIWVCPFWNASRFPASWPTPKICVWGNRWLLFRLILGAGLIKLRGDQVWRDLTALDYHYETMPIPSPLSWYFHNQPHGAHVFQVVVNHIIECALSFLVILPFRQCRIVGGLIQILFQIAILLTGNFAFLNYMTIVSAIMCFDDHFLTCLFPSETLQHLPHLVRGCGGSWSCPLVQAWPFGRRAEALGGGQVVGEKVKTGEFEGDERGEEGQESRESDTAGGDTTTPLLGNDDTDHPHNRDDQLNQLPLNEEVHNDEASRSCCCWYRPHLGRFLRSLRVPRSVRQQMKTDIEENWMKLVCEGVASAGILACMAFVTNPATSAVWMVIVVFFLAIYLAGSSTFFTKSLVSHVFVEIILLIVTLWSFIALYQQGPAVWSVWLTACLFTVLIAFAYTTLTNAALIFKIHVELLITLLIIALSIPVVYNLLSPNQIMDSTLGNPFSIVNAHGAFGSIPRERQELIIQGTAAASPDEKAEWRSYEFNCKPGNVYRRPCVVAPYHYRLDWLMWFVPMVDETFAPENFPWFFKLLSKLLENSGSVTALLAHNPFHNSNPPTALRVLRMQYRFTEGPFIGRGPWWEIVPGTEELFVAPADIPGAEKHLKTQLVRLQQQQEEERQERKRREEAVRKRKEREAFERRMEWARQEEERRRKEAEEEERRRAEEAKQKEEEEKLKELQRQRAAEQKQREEMRKAAEEEEKKRRQEEEKRLREEERRKQEEEAQLHLEKQKAEEQERKQKEEAAKKEAAKREQEAQAAKEEERRRELEATRLREQQEAAKREKERSAKETEARRQELEEEKRRKEQEELERKRQRTLEEERQRVERMSGHKAATAPLVGEHGAFLGGGVPLRAAAFLHRGRKKALR